MKHAMQMFKSLLITPLMISAFAVCSPAFAAPPTDKTPTTIQDALKDVQLPSQAEIDDMLEQMPDFNALMSDMIEIAKDEKVRTRLKSSAETFKDKIDKSDVLTKRDANGLPDIKALMSVMLGAMSDEGVAGELLEGAAELAEEMEALAEKHAPQPKPKP